MLRCTLILLAAFMAACATPGRSDYNYSPPNGESPINKMVVEEQFSVVWDRLVGGLAESFFVINNIEKESRIINVSFSTSEPERYVDCGTTMREFAYGGESRNYTYRTAESSSFKFAGKWGAYQNLPMVAEISRDTTLEGRANIYVAPHGEKTLVSVNAKYVLSVRATGVAHGYNLYGTLMRSDRMPPETNTMSFTTLEPGHEVWGANGEVVECLTQGILEENVLSLATP